MSEKHRGLNGFLEAEADQKSHELLCDLYARQDAEEDVTAFEFDDEPAIAERAEQYRQQLIPDDQSLEAYATVTRAISFAAAVGRTLVPEIVPNEIFSVMEGTAGDAAQIHTESKNFFKHRPTLEMIAMDFISQVSPKPFYEEVARQVMGVQWCRLESILGTEDAVGPQAEAFAAQLDRPDLAAFIGRQGQTS